jgi:hypothetical protein
MLTGLILIVHNTQITLLGLFPLYSQIRGYQKSGCDSLLWAKNNPCVIGVFRVIMVLIICQLAFFKASKSNKQLALGSVID